MKYFLHIKVFVTKFTATFFKNFGNFVIVNVMGYNNKPQLFFSCEGGAWDWDLLSRNHFSAEEISI